MKLVKSKDLKPGDVVKMPGSSLHYGTATIKRVDETFLYAFRPYVHAVNYGSYCPCYIGIEEYPIPRNDCEWELLSETPLEKLA